MKQQKDIKPGRPPLFKEPMSRYLVMLREEDAAYLERIGGGNRSKGIRELIEKDRAG